MGCCVVLPKFWSFPSQAPRISECCALEPVEDRSFPPVLSHCRRYHSSTPLLNDVYDLRSRPSEDSEPGKWTHMKMD
jgi:hypothetical protein